MTSARAKQSRPRKVSKPGSPGPAPTRNTFPAACLMASTLSIDLAENAVPALCKQAFRQLGPQHPSVRGAADHRIANNPLAVHTRDQSIEMQPVMIDSRVRRDRDLAPALQPIQHGPFGCDGHMSDRIIEGREQ